MTDYLPKYTELYPEEVDEENVCAQKPYLNFILAVTAVITVIVIIIVL